MGMKGIRQILVNNIIMHDLDVTKRFFRFFRFLLPFCADSGIMRRMKHRTLDRSWPPREPASFDV